MTAKIEIFTSPTCPHCPHAVRIAEELKKERDDIRVVETSLHSMDGQKRAKMLEVRSVPTLFITGPGTPERIGFIGTPGKNQLNKMVNIALGKDSWPEKISLFSRLKKVIKNES